MFLCSPQGHKAVVFGVPDCGKVCSEQHVPSYLHRLDELRRLGINKILCVAVGDAAAADSWAHKLSLDDGSKVQVRGAGAQEGLWKRRWFQGRSSPTQTCCIGWLSDLQPTRLVAWLP